MTKHEQQRVSTWIREFRKLGERGRSEQEKFRDFCELAYCSYAKLTALNIDDADKLEERYMKIVARYRNQDVIRAYPEFLAEIIMAVQDDSVDFLGMIAAELNVLDAHNGQYFTPMSVCRLMAKMNMPDTPQIIEKKGYLKMAEPCAGSGAMVIAYAQEMRYAGYDPAVHLLVHATELNQLSYQMCFIQLTAAGIPAAVIHGNSLSLEIFESAWTPAAINAFYKHHGRLAFGNKSKVAPDVETEEYQEAAQAVEIPPQVYAEPPRQQQLAMFDFGRDA